MDNYDRLASWRATTDRITSFEESFQALQQPRTDSANSDDTDTLWLDEVALGLPGGQPLLKADGLALKAGDAVLIRGPSGSGKSTLFRALAGIWPWARSRWRKPADFEQRVMYLPQRPYFPNGTLRQALAYPEAAERYPDAELRQALDNALLPHLVRRLDEEDTWGQKLSGGEQQRLAVARALLKRPRWLFVDEATSALDETAEARIYQHLKAMVAAEHGALVSIAHRPTVAGFHDRVWELDPVHGTDGSTSSERVLHRLQPAPA